MKKITGEAKHLLFTINSDTYQKGDYSMQVFYNGALVGKMVKNYPEIDPLYRNIPTISEMAQSMKSMIISG